jgi:hypothetical protein
VEIEIKLSKLHAGQQKVLGEAKRFNVLCCGRRWGKSELATDIICETALDGDPVGYFTPTYKLLSGTYDETLGILSPLVQRKNDGQFIEIAGGGRIEFWSLENALAGRSRKYKKIIVDEAAFVKDLWKKWTENLRPTLTDMKGDGWFLSTPRGKNDFHKLFSRGTGGDEGWMSWQMDTYTNPHIDPLELNDAKADLPELAWLQEYMAQFNANVANPFGAAFIQQCTFPLSNEPAVCFGIDLAKSHDWTVIIGLDKNCMVCYFDRFQMDWGSTTRAILNLPDVDMAIDSTGVGDPIAEDICRVRGNAEGVKFTAISKQQMMEGLAKSIQTRAIGFPEGQITDELDNFEYEFTRTGVKYSAPGGLHDDCVMALALARRKWVEMGGFSYGTYSFDD